MKATAWRDDQLEQHLRNLADGEGVVPGVPNLSAGLMNRTRERLAERRPARRVLPAVAAALTLLFLIPAGLLAAGKPILGFRVTIAEMTPEEWIRKGFSGWLASQAPEFLSPEESARVAPFPIRVPAWLPDGYEAVSEPKGAHPYRHRNGRWEVNRDAFFVSQSFRSGTDQSILSILQNALPTQRSSKGMTMAPGTEILEVAGHPAFLELNKPLAKADKENEERSKRGELPEIVGYTNTLRLWVEEPDGQITEIQISGPFDPKTRIKVGASLFGE